ncbi:response regulator [Halalkalibacter krulwichiae]|uniref:Bifunctional transcriptional activator/DNA repair enzyme AdaA n=1 Tax=Halalkalibacter krulwichiae TaxID=199441 RepID=A0A1X9MBV2_9BACI|nr:response regulator [Halalkalibacter krulwichiae]ARK30070.1 Bifunctional transcriptional activator/DNA repair enzyme AdaA [Halalkalibacter krulwichiae]
MKVLLVDDEFNVRDVIRSLGQWQTYGVTTVLEANNGKEAKRLIERESPEIIFTDVKMPEMSGIELIEWLDAISYPGKVIMVTVCDDYSFMRKAIQYSSFDYLLKPIEVDALNQALSGAVNAWKSEEEERQNKESGIYEDVKSLRMNRVVTAACNGEPFDAGQISLCLPQADGYDLALLSFYQMHDSDSYIQLLTKELCDRKWGNAFALLNDHHLCVVMTVPGKWLAVEEWISHHFDIPIRYFSIPLKSLEDLPSSFQAAQREMDDLNFRSINRLTHVDDAMRMHDIVAYVDKYFTEEVSLEKLSNRFFLSREHISRRFKQEKGVTLSEYVTQLRIEQAKQWLIQTDEKVYSISIKLGYQDGNFFSKLFKKMVGMTPIQYRDYRKGKTEKVK